MNLSRRPPYLFTTTATSLTTAASAVSVASLNPHHIRCCCCCLAVAIDSTLRLTPTCLSFSLSLSSYSLCVFTVSDVRLPSLISRQRFFTAVVQLSQQLIRSRCRCHRSCICLCLCRCFCRCPCLATGGLLATQFVTHTFAHTVRDTCIVPLLINVAKSCLLVTIWNLIFVWLIFIWFNCLLIYLNLY